jgi:hypothetical protein
MLASAPAAIGSGPRWKPVFRGRRGFYLSRLVGAALIAVVPCVTATADDEACRGAMFVFRSGKTTVGDYVRRYASCLSRSDGHSDCSSEFSRLRSAQEDFEAAVLDYQRECP